jgi:Protein of unknown function (DUF3999)
VFAMAQLPITWKNWRYSAPIDAPAADAPRYVSVTVPAVVMSHATRGLSDLRVVDADGKEVPYALTAKIGGRVTDRREARLLEPSVAAGQYSQAMFDLGKSPRIHNVITIGIEGQDDLLTWVEVAVSDDHQHWRVVRERAPIYRLQQAGLEERTTIGYSESVARYLRVRILDGSRPYTIARGDVVYEQITEAERVKAGVTLSASAGGTSSSVWTADSPPMPMSEVRFETSQKTFYRPVSVEASDDGKSWTRVASGEIFRTVEAGQPRESLSVAFPESIAAHWRVAVLNRNDAALTDVRAELYTTPRHVVLQQSPGQQYRLIYGNARATAPQYDLARTINSGAAGKPLPVTTGDETENSSYADPAPWTEQHQSVLWGALGLAILVLGALAVRTMRGPRAT